MRQQLGTLGERIYAPLQRDHRQVTKIQAEDRSDRRSDGTPLASSFFTVKRYGYKIKHDRPPTAPDRRGYPLRLAELQRAEVQVLQLHSENFGRGADVTPWKIRCEQIKIPRADGSELRLCVYSPRKREGEMPGLLWIHGGGYAMGIPEQDHGFVRSFVGATGCVMVVPDYKKSLYAPFPAALEDCYLALCSGSRRTAKNTA